MKKFIPAGVWLAWFVFLVVMFNLYPNENEPCRLVGTQVEGRDISVGPIFNQIRHTVSPDLPECVWGKTKELATLVLFAIDSVALTAYFVMRSDPRRHSRAKETATP